MMQMGFVPKPISSARPFFEVQKRQKMNEKIFLNLVIMDKKRKQELFNRAKKFFELPLLVLTLLLIPLVVISELLTLSEEVLVIFEVIDWIIWGAFALELITLTYLAENRLRHLLRSWLDVIIVLLPLLRFLRLLRIARLARLSRFARAARFTRLTRLLRVFLLISREFESIRKVFGRHKINFAFIFSLILVIIFGFLVVSFEGKAEKANITSVADGIWWAIVTIATVGYGDRYPVTLPGRVIGVILMFLGVAMFSLFTANIASFFTESEKEKEKTDLEKRLQRLEEKINQLVKTSNSSSSDKVGEGRQSK
jgi:voltage-gated potassium channel